MAVPLRCADCGTPIPKPVWAGRPPVYCPACKHKRVSARNAHKLARARERYAADPDYRERRLAAKRRGDFALTRKVPTPFGAVFVHVARAGAAPAEVWFSMQGRRHSTEVHESLDALATVINELLEGEGGGGAG